MSAVAILTRAAREGDVQATEQASRRMRRVRLRAESVRASERVGVVLERLEWLQGDRVAAGDAGGQVCMVANA